MLNFFDWLSEFLLKTLPNLLMDFVMWILGMLAYIVIKIVNVLYENVFPLFGFDDFNGFVIFEKLKTTWNSLPIDVIYICSYLNLPAAFAIITSALFIRFIKDKIPFL